MKKSHVVWAHLVGILLLAVVITAGVLMWLDSYTRHGQGVAVPDVRNMPLFEAAKILQMKELEYAVSDSNYVKNKPAGHVLECNPAPGQSVKTGRIVYLIINKANIPEQSIPDVIENSSVRQAEAAMTAAGFKLTDHEFINGETDWIYGVRYKRRLLSPGEKVPMGAVLTLIVGNGMPKIELNRDSVDTHLNQEGQ